MHITLRNLRTVQLTVLAVSSIVYTTVAESNLRRSNNSFIDILPDALCPNYHSGRLSMDNCRGYVDCMNGFEIDRATCEEGTLFSMRTENCEPEDMVPACARSTANDNPGITVADRIAKPKCDDGLCTTPEGECAVLHQCLIDPCDTKQCGENEECLANFCGGCHATCTLKLNTIDQVMDASTSTEVPDATRSATASTPLLADDGGMYRTSSTSPQIVYDGPDAVAPWSTTVAATTTEEVISTTAATTTEEAVVDPTPDSSSEEVVYVPNWTTHTCVVSDEDDTKNMKSTRLGSSWHPSFASQYECCVNNFMYSLELFESCVDFNLESLEPSSDDENEYYPIWHEGKCKATDGTEDVWLETTFRPKKYLCCFEYFKWQFDNCLIAQ